MPVVTLFSCSHCAAEKVADGVAEALQLTRLEAVLYQQAAERYRVSGDKLRNAVHGPVSQLPTWPADRTKYAAYLRATLIELVKQDNAFYFGFGGHLLPRRLRHFLHICLVSSPEERTAAAVEQDGISIDRAGRRIRRADEERSNWTTFLHGKAPYDDTLYHWMIPLHATPVEDAVEIISRLARKEEFQTTPESQKALDNALLEARARVALIEKGKMGVALSASGSEIYISGSQGEELPELDLRQIEEILLSLPGIENVSTLDRVTGTEVPLAPVSKGLMALPKKIMLVDDEKEFAETLAERLLTRNIESIIAHDGEEALKKLNEELPGIMILDIRMPGMDGLDVLRHVKAAHPDLEVIMLTGHGSKKEESLARQLGAYAYLNKPIKIDILVQTMQEATQKQTTRKAIQS
ncbi:response regulator [bacterium]|nr:response regulator [bacterium]MBU1651117.1 response regulator [bacterium]